jgi:hypothetical protein
MNCLFVLVFRSLPEDHNEKLYETGTTIYATIQWRALNILTKEAEEQKASHLFMYVYESSSNICCLSNFLEPQLDYQRL